MRGSTALQIALTPMQVAVAEHRDRVAARNGDAARAPSRPRCRGLSPAAAAILAEIRHAVLQRPHIERLAAAERAEGHVVGIKNRSRSVC